MSSKQKKNKKRFHFPKRSGLLYILLFLIPIAIFFLIAIPILYVNNYNKYKLQIFPDVINDSIDVVYVDGNEKAIPDFNFVIYCDTYNNSSELNQIKFSYFAYYNEHTVDAFKVTSSSATKPSYTVRLQMNCDWIEIQNNGVASSSGTTKTIATTPNEAKPASTSASSSFFQTTTISNIPKLPKKGDLPFVKVSSIPLYVYITYTVKENAQTTTKHYVLKYEYKNYIVGPIKFNEGKDNEVTFGPTTGGI